MPDDPAEASVARLWQGLAAGLVSGGVGAVFVTVFGSGSVALLVNSAWVRDWLYHGQHLTASAVYGRELFASQNAASYVFLLVGFPIIGFVMSLIGTAIANPAPRLPDSGEPRGPGRPPGPPGPEPPPDPPGGGRHVQIKELASVGGG